MNQVNDVGVEAGPISRRVFVLAASIVGGAVLSARAAARSQGGEPETEPGALGAFPAQDPALVREMVGASHGRLARVKELLKDAPRLANAAWDWGFGDWETALGAAAHTGQRAIAELLIEHGARVDVYALAMLGRTGAVRAMVEATPGLQRVRGPHGLTLMHHARAGGEPAREVQVYLDTLGDADVASPDEPVVDDTRAACLGVYAFGPSGGERLEVYNDEKSGRLMLKRVAKGAAGRGLLRVGPREFHPVGAPEVRIRFEADRKFASKVWITTPAPLLEAGRVEW